MSHTGRRSPSEPAGLALSTETYRLHGSIDPAASEWAARAPVSLILVERTSTLPSEAALRERFGLTPREVEVTRLLVQGYTDKEVAEELFISPHTARSHSERILNKMDRSSRTGILHACRERCP